MKSKDEDLFVESCLTLTLTIGVTILCLAISMTFNLPFGWNTVLICFGASALVVRMFMNFVI